MLKSIDTEHERSYDGTYAALYAWIWSAFSARRAHATQAVDGLHLAWDPDGQFSKSGSFLGSAL